MGRPRANLADYSPWGAVPVPPPGPPDPAWLPVVSAEGMQTWSDLAIWALQFIQSGAEVALFTNFYQPQSDSTYANFILATAAGVGPQTLPAAVSKGINPAGRALWKWPVVTFTASGAGLPELIWGYVVSCIDPFSGQRQMLWAQRLVNSFGFVNPGDALPIPLALSLGQC